MAETVTDEVPENGLNENREGAPKLRLSQTSNNGVRVIAGNIAEEEKTQSLALCNANHSQMLKDATIAPAVSAVEMAIARVPWEIKAQPRERRRASKTSGFPSTNYD